MNSSRSVRGLLAGALLLLILGFLPGGAQPANATSPTTITLASGTSVNDQNGDPAVVVTPNARWGSIPGAFWINSPADDGSDDTFTITFALPAAYFGVQLSGAFFADNWATVWLNGVQIAAQTAGDVYPNYGYDDSLGTPTAPPTSFLAIGGFVPGANTLMFQVSNAGGPPNDGNPEALDFLATVTFLTVATDKDQCKKGGWEDLVDSEGNSFKNQGDCVSYVATGGKNLGAIAAED
ncbi:MAG: hypothetical protein C0506_16400 [Anaerolinea sp.]|nr:hypothetical protein [Anaerolinea sp.]